MISIGWKKKKVGGRRKKNNIHIKTHHSSAFWGTLSFRIFCYTASATKKSSGSTKFTHSFLSESKNEWPANAWGLTKAFSILSPCLGCHRDLPMFPLQSYLIIPGEDCWRQGAPWTCRLNPPRWQSSLKRQLCRKIRTYFRLIYFITVQLLWLTIRLDNSLI